MVRKFAVAALVLAAGLAACTTPTPYQPRVAGKAASAGFSEQRIETDRWRISFNGNSLTSRETVETYLLYRAAELTLAQGRDGFAIVDRNTEKRSRTYVEPEPFYAYGPRYGAWRPAWRYHRQGFGWRGWDPFWGGPFWADRLDVRTIDRFEASAEILMRAGPKPADDPAAFDARSVVANLEPGIKRPAP